MGRVEAHGSVNPEGLHQSKTITADRSHAYEPVNLSLVLGSEPAYPGFMDMHGSCKQTPGGNLTRW